MIRRNYHFRGSSGHLVTQHFLPALVGAVFAFATVSLRAQLAGASPSSNDGSFHSSAGRNQADSAGDEPYSATNVAHDSGPNAEAPGGLRPGSYGGLDVPAALPAERIFAILQEQPDAVVDLKPVMADLAQQQGKELQADEITDEMLYRGIASSAELRAAITTFLHARGYLSDSDLESYAGGPGLGLIGGNEAGIDERRGNDSVAGSLGAARGGEPDFDGSEVPSERRVDAGRTEGTADANDVYSPGDASRLTFAQSPAKSGSANRANEDRQRDPTNEPRVLHRPTPYNLLSLRDLYAQQPEDETRLRRFGSDVFVHRDGSSPSQIGANGRETPLDVPAGPDYVVGPGDSLSIDLWGGVSQSFTRVIDREGRVALPESGAVQVAGLSLARVQDVIAQQLQQQYRNVQVAVTVGRLRSIRIYVVGDVQRPGAYDISSLSNSLSALYAAGGPTNTGSLRVLRHYRGKELVGEIDLYDFLLHGVAIEDRLESGDTLLVPPSGPRIAIYGAVKRPAIYELRGEPESTAVEDPARLATVLDEAGGATVAADLAHIVVDRIDANQRRETVSLDLPAGGDLDAARAAVAAFAVHDGDRVHVTAILPYSQRVVYVEGHVARPGRTPFRDGMMLNDVLRSYQDLLPEPADKGEIVRLVAPDLHPETIEFNVPDLLIGNGNVPLQPFDTVRIHGRYEADAPRVSIGGEVLRPGTYALSAGMSAAQLVRMAGGFKRDALLDTADLISYSISGGNQVVSERTSVPIGDAVLRHERTADVTLKPGDVLTVHQITGWNDIGSSITIQGEVAHPGSYGIQQGERLSSILERAGGLRETSYPAGAVLLREEVRRLEQKSREELIRQIESSSTAARVGPDLGSTDQTAKLQLIAQQQEQVLERLKSQPVTGRLVIHISSDIASWKGTPADIEVRAGDVLRVPKRPGFVLVSGEVFNASAITFEPNKSAGWYLRRAGGATQVADTKDIFIIRANGSVVGRERGVFGHDVLATRLDPGDVVVVPQKIIGASVFWRNLLTVAQVTSSIALTAAVAGVL